MRVSHVSSCVYVCVSVQHGCKWLSPDIMCVNVCVWQACCGEGLCNVNKQQQQQQQQSRWLPLSLSYVVIRSGWKCGATVPLTLTKHFSQAEDYTLKLNAVCSPLCVPHVATPLATPSSALSFATGHLRLHPRCVIWSPSTAQVPNPLCV